MTLLQNLNQMAAALEAAGLDAGAHAASLNRVETHLRRYADLEKRLLEHVWIPVPRHLLGADLSGDPMAVAEELAARERDRLGLGQGEVGDMHRLLDDQGLKVYRPQLPAESPLEGWFLFDREVGPALVASAGLSPEDTDFVLARLYGHYLLDHDPYRIRLILREAPSDPGALRAHAFAAAFLVSRRGVEAYLAELGVAPGEPVTASTVNQLAVYFEVSARTLLTRLLGLARVAAGQVEGIMAGLSPAAPAASDDRSAVSERFTRLALEAHARRLFNLKELARYLETDPGEAGRLAARFVLSEAPSADAPEG